MQNSFKASQLLTCSQCLNWTQEREKINKRMVFFLKMYVFSSVLLNINGSTVFLFRSTARGVVQPSEHKVPGCTDLFRVSLMGVVVLLLKRWPWYPSCRWNRGWNGCKSPDASVHKHNSAPLLTTRNPQVHRKRVIRSEMASLTSAITPWTAEAHLAPLISALHLT